MNDNRIGALVVKETQLTGSIILSIFYQIKWFSLDENETYMFTEFWHGRLAIWINKQTNKHKERKKENKNKTEHANSDR